LRRYSDMGRKLTEVEILEGDKPGDRRVVYKIAEGPCGPHDIQNFRNTERHARLYWPVE
jgi:ribosomal protein S28E/S33